MRCWAIIGFVLTIAFYSGAKRLHARFPVVWLEPAIVTPALLVAVMSAAHVSYAACMADSQWLLRLLGPTTVAFAVPVYEHRDVIRRHWFGLAIGVMVGMTVACISSLALARIFQLPPDLVRALLLHSISTPFALAVSDRLGASRDLVSLFVVLTGLAGALLGEATLALTPLISRLARGVALGAGALGFGVAVARRLGSEEAVVASIAMMFSGILMVLAAPLLLRLPGLAGY